MSEPIAAESKAVQSFRLQLRHILISAIVLGAGLTLLGHPGIAAAEWSLQGNPISDPSFSFQARAAVTEESGDIVIVWEATPDPQFTPFSVWIQRITADGVPAPNWPTLGKLITTAPGILQTEPQVVRDWSDGVFVTWRESVISTGDDCVRLQRVLPDGSRAPGWPERGLIIHEDDTGDDLSLQLISDFPGTRAIVVWANRPLNADHATLFAQQVDSDGHRQWAAGGVQVSDVPVGLFPDGGVQVMSAVGDESLGFYAAWVTNLIGPEQICVQHITEAGVCAPGVWTPSGRGVSNAGGLQLRPGIACDGLSFPEIPLTAGVHVFWMDSRFGPSDFRLFGTHILPDGTSHSGYPNNGREFAQVYDYSSSPDKRAPTPVAGDRNGGAFVGWQADPDSTFVTAVDLHGNPRWNPARKLLQATGKSWYLHLAANTEFIPPFQPAGVYATWLDAHASAKQLRAQHFNPYGYRALPTTGAVLHYYPAGAFHPNYLNHDLQRLGYGKAVAIFNAPLPESPEISGVYANVIHGVPNLSYSGPPPNGWSDYGVPSILPNGTEEFAELSDELNGNDESTWVSVSFANDGPYATPPSVRRLTLDGETSLFELPAVEDLEVGTSLHPAEGPFTIRGGRHSLALNADALNDVPESNEEDNVWETQFIWSPLFLSVGRSEERAVPPNPIFPLPNADGFMFTRPSLYAWVVALAPQDPGDDYDLHVYDDYQGSQSGYSNLRGLSLYGSNNTDFVVGHYSGTPTTLYPAAVRYAIAGGGQNFYIDQQNAEGRNAGGTGFFRGQQLVNRRLADVYEANLTAGSSYHFHVLRTTGDDDLALRIFLAVPGGIYAPYESAAESFPTSPSADELYFTAPATGWYPLVVYRTDGTEATQEFLAYDLTWEPSTTGLADQPPTTPPATPLALAFLPPAPNPTAGPATLAFDLPAAGAVRLDVFDVTGRQVRRLVDRTLAAGRQEVLWDGKDAAGHRAPRGIYLVRLTSPSGEQLTRRVQLLR